MATLSASNLTLIDWAKRLDPDGSVPIIAELLSQTNEILEDAVYKEGNLPTGERVSIRTGLPDVYWRAINEGIPPSKSTTAQVDESCSILESVSNVDIDLANLNMNTPEFRLSEDQAFLEAMNIQMSKALFYGDTAVTPKEFLGLAPRYSDMNAKNKDNILKAGSTTDDQNTSIWLVVWGDNTSYLIFPKGSTAGLIHEDLGEQTIYMTGNKRMQAYVTRYQWKTGFVLKDWRYVVRIGNIDVVDLMSQANKQAPDQSTAIIKLMAIAAYRIPSLSMGQAAFYMNRTVHAGLSLAALEKNSSFLQINEALTEFGKPDNWLSFLGIPLRLCDSIKINEPLIPAAI